jgi:TonB family protein
MRVYGYSAAVALACALSACGSAPSSVRGSKPQAAPYWTDPRFDAALFEAVQSVVRYPDDVIDPSLGSIRGTVQFTIVDGKVQDPQMTESTGHPGLDELMLRQVASASIPQPTGSHADEPHAFSMELSMPTAFELAEYTAINFRKIYPKEAILGGDEGSVTVDFDYLDGKASNVIVTKSANNRFLDGASLSAVSKADLPLPPPGYAGKTVHLEVTMCYSLNNSFKCPATGNFIPVTGTRVVRRYSY